jgi:hypothetical protein
LNIESSEKRSSWHQIRRPIYQPSQEIAEADIELEQPSQDVTQHPSIRHGKRLMFEAVKSNDKLVMSSAQMRS